MRFLRKLVGLAAVGAVIKVVASKFGSRGGSAPGPAGEQAPKPGQAEPRGRMLADDDPVPAGQSFAQLHEPPAFDADDRGRPAALEADTDDHDALEDSGKPHPLEEPPGDDEA